MLAEVPPLVTLGRPPGARPTPLLFQRIGGIVTDDPLLTVAQTNRGRLMVLLGEEAEVTGGLPENRSHAAFDDLVAKLIQYLTDPGVDRFRWRPLALDEDQRDLRGAGL